MYNNTYIHIYIYIYIYIHTLKQAAFWVATSTPSPTSLRESVVGLAGAGQNHSETKERQHI